MFWVRLVGHLFGGALSKTHRPLLTKPSLTPYSLSAATVETGRELVRSIEEELSDVEVRQLASCAAVVVTKEGV